MRILTILALLLTVSCHKKETPKRPPPQVRVSKAVGEDTYLFNSYVGHVKALVQVEVQAQVEGVLTGYYFTEGQEVKKGDLLFTIDSRPYEAQLAKATGALAQSIANLRYAQDVVSRNTALAKQDYVSKLQYDQYITTVMTTEAEIEQNKAEIETAKINISYCNIHAPMNAVTGVLQINVGNLIKNAEETPLVTLNQITPTYAYFSVPQKDLPEIMSLQRKEALQVKAFLNGDYDKPFEGTLDLIDNQVNDKTGSIWLRGIFPNEDKMLWPGEFVDIQLIKELKKSAVLVPTEAVITGQKGKYLFVVKDGNAVEIRYVKTGQRIKGMTLIEKGVDAGEEVVIQGQINLINGSKVTVQKAKKQA